MKYFLAFCLIVGVASATSDRPLYDPYAIMLRQQRQFNLLGNTRGLIENLVDNLRKAVQQARDAIGSFTSSVQDEAQQIREKITNDIQKLVDRVAVAIDEVSDRLIDSGVGVVGCVSTSREEAAVLFNETLTKSLACVDERIKEVNAQIEGLSSITTDAAEFSNKIVEDMRQCTTNNANILSIGTCLGNVAVHAEMKVALFATQTAVTIGRISLSIATLPASLEVCAGTRLVEAGIATTKIIMEIGSCSTSAVFGSMSGSNTDTPALPSNPELPPIPSLPENIEQSAPNTQEPAILRK